MYKGMKVLYVIDGVIEGKQHNIEQALPNRYSLSLSLSLFCQREPCRRGGML
jgi:hypothetical protein